MVLKVVLQRKRAHENKQLSGTHRYSQDASHQDWRIQASPPSMGYWLCTYFQLDICSLIAVHSEAYGDKTCARSALMKFYTYLPDHSTLC
jgi:hypothetical protein